MIRPDLVRCFTQSPVFAVPKLDENRRRYVDLPATTQVSHGLNLADAQRRNELENWVIADGHRTGVAIESMEERCERAEREAYALRVAYDQLADVVSLSPATWQTRRVYEVRSVREALLAGNLTVAVRRAEAIDAGSGQ